MTTVNLDSLTEEIPFDELEPLEYKISYHLKQTRPVTELCLEKMVAFQPLTLNEKKWMKKEYNRMCGARNRLVNRRQKFNDYSKYVSHRDLKNKLEVLKSMKDNTFASLLAFHDIMVYAQRAIFIHQTAADRKTIKEFEDQLKEK